MAEAVIELVKAKKPFDRENLEATYVKRRRESWVEKDALVAEKARELLDSGAAEKALLLTDAALAADPDSRASGRSEETAFQDRSVAVVVETLFQCWH